MKNQFHFRRLFAIIAAVCTLAAVWLVIKRIRVEEPQKHVAVVTSWDDIELLCSFSDASADEWLSAFKEGGLQAVMVPEAQMEDEAITKLIQDAGLEIAQVGGEAKGGIYFFAEKYDTLMFQRLSPSVKRTREVEDQKVILPSIENSGSTLVLVENIMQTASFIPRDYRLIHFDGNIAKCFWVNKAFEFRYGTLGYDSSQEIVNMMFRAVIDRGMNVIWLGMVATEDGHPVADPQEYTQMLQNLEKRISQVGYSYGFPDSTPAFTMSPILLAICGLGVMAACMLVLGYLYTPKRRWLYPALYVILALESIAAPFIIIELQMQILALLAALAFPALAVLLLAKLLRQTPAGKHASIKAFAGALISCLAIVLWGCMYISAVQTTSLYLLVLRLFRGVKLSQLGMYGFSALVMAWTFLHKEGNSLRNDIRDLLPRDDRRVRSQTLAAVAVIVVAGIIYILRTGDGMLSVPTLEQRLRNDLETILIFRPRTKEFLVAFPAVAAAFVFAAHSNRVWTCLFGILGGIGFASVANTFCHMRAHFTVSLYRTLIGAVIGLVLGIIIILIARLLPMPDTAEKTTAKE